MSISPAELIGHIASFSDNFSHNICQGTILLWCSIVVINISSSFCNWFSAQALATMFIPSVVPFVKIICSGVSEPIKSPTIFLVSSYSLVAFWLSS